MIDENDIKRLDERYMTRQECNNITEEIKEENTKNSTALAVMQQKIDTITWVSKTTLAAVIAALVGAVLKLVLAG